MLTVLVLAHHVITAAILFDGHIAFGAFFRIRRYPITGLRVIVAFLDPFLQPTAFHRIVPVFTAHETEHMTAFTTYWPRFSVANLHRVRTVNGRTPAQQLIALDETVGNQLLVFDVDSMVEHQFGNGHIVHQYITAMCRTGYRLSQSLADDLRRQIFSPARKTESMTTFQTSH